MAAPQNPAAPALAAHRLRTLASPPRTVWEPGAGPHPMRVAMERHDVRLLIESLHPDVVAYSPVTPHPFVGVYEVAGLIKHLMDGFEEFGYSDELTNGRLHAILFRGRVMGRVVTGVDVLRLDEYGRILSLEISARPPAGVFAVAAHFSPMFARWRRGRIPAALLRALLRFLPASVAAADVLGSHLARARHSRG